MTIISWNVEGLNSCIDDEDFINLVSECDILFFSETWQRAGDSFHLKGYEGVDVPRRESMHGRGKRGHGGVCLFIRAEIKDGIHILEKDDSGVIWVKLCKNFFHLESDLCFCFAYIPPQDSAYYKQHNVGYFELIENGIRKYSSVGKISIIGDLNARCGMRSDIIYDSNVFDKYINTVDSSDTSNHRFELPERFSMDKICNSSGIKLLDICTSTDIKIVNGRMGDDAGH
ncbi:MAG: endonuclease/exonuclease/phosphatase family protein, partial [Candidatus Thiodiazotropha sp.]